MLFLKREKTKKIWEIPIKTPGLLNYKIKLCHNMVTSNIFFNYQRHIWNQSNNEMSNLIILYDFV